jgi:hypothetical protein
MKALKFLVLAVALTTIWTACKKDAPNINTNTSSTQTTMSGTTTNLNVHLTDAPGNFQQVNVDITGIEFKTTDSTTVNLNVKAGIYNLLDFANGVDTLIANGVIKSGTLSQVRLILGSNNSVKVDGVVYPLSTPSAMQSGLKINVNSVLTPGVAYDLLLDFDANQSIVLKGNGEYQLKPVIRAVSKVLNGSIKGSVTTLLALPATVSATDGVNIYTTITDVNGNYILQGIPTGVYAVTITPKAPYLPITIPGVNVSNGNQTLLTATVF